MSPRVTYRVQNNVGVITFDDGKANVFNHESIAELNAALDLAEKDSTCAVVVAGRSSIFSGGLDLRLLPTLEVNSIKTFLRSYGELMARFYLFSKPVIAASTGHALAGGCVLLLTCEIRIGAEGAFKIGLNETRISLVLPTAVIAIAAGVLPAHVHAQVMLHGYVHTPQQALANRLYDEIVPPDQVLARALERALELAPVNRAAYYETKRRLREPTVKAALACIESEIDESWKMARG